ncbi:Protein kinase domain-containing protein [Streptomyces sp. 1331.2]|nr:Protein kinase domain-containing protein [Streptomyces sp. 1331.2]
MESGMEIGRVVGGRYRIEAGGVGEVRFARDTGSGQPVVVKVPAEAPGPAVRLRHPGIVTVLEAGEHEGKPFLAMERLDGYTLEDHLLDGWYRAAEVADFGAQVAEALAVAHRAGTAHGGIEPARLLLTPTGVVKILGFGTLPPAPSSDLSALGTTMRALLGHPVLPGSLGELGVIVAELLDSPAEQDPHLTGQFAARLRRLAQDLEELEDREPARQPRGPVGAQSFWVYQRPERLPAGRVLVAVICAALVAVTAFAIAVTA